VRSSPERRAYARCAHNLPQLPQRDQELPIFNCVFHAAAIASEIWLPADSFISSFFFDTNSPEFGLPMLL